MCSTRGIDDYHCLMLYRLRQRYPNVKRLFNPLRQRGVYRTERQDKRSENQVDCHEAIAKGERGDAPPAAQGLRLRLDKDELQDLRKEPEGPDAWQSKQPVHWEG